MLELNVTWYKYKQKTEKWLLLFLLQQNTEVSEEVKKNLEAADEKSDEKKKEALQNFSLCILRKRLWICIKLYLHYFIL